MAEEVIGLLFGVDGGGAIDGRSGQQIVSDLTKIVNQINSGKSTVPKVQLKFDTSHAKTALQELKTQLQEIAGMGNISVSGMSSRGGSGGSAGVKQDAENYRALTATVKQYYAALAEVEKIQMKSTAVSSSGGVWSTTDAQYDARIQKINQLKTQFDSLGVSVNAAGVVEMNSAQQLNITEEQRAMLLAQVQSAITANGLAHEKGAAQISATWDKNAAKVHEYILRIQDVASKNAEVNALMTELNKLAASGNPQNLDELTTKFAQLQQKVRETNADVQTFGQKLSKTFGSQLRYMLTSMVYMKALQFIKDLYNNVVELDKAMTDLQIASGKTRAEIKELTKRYADLAKQLGATTAEVAKSADTWLRQGYAAEETNTLIKNSTMLAKLGQMESAEASKALTSAMKGYKVAVEDSIGIVDKFTAVDMEAAASAGEIATAMAETATSADIAGVSMDKLIGYIATVKEVTQDGAESVGTFYKTLFARMNNVKAGKFVDDETGEALNDVEKVLGNLDIALRDTTGQFRNSGEVLDEVAARWESFDSVSQHAIATAFAGTRQQEKFIVLMENYGTALGYAETATQSAGTATEKFSAYTDSIEGKLNSLKASFEEFSLVFLDSDLVAGVIGFFTLIMNGMTGVASFIDSIGGLPTILLAVATALLLVNGGLIAYNAQMKITAAYQAILLFFTKLKAGLMNIVTAIPNAIVAWKAYAAGTVSASTAMQASIPVIGLVLAAVTALVGGLSLYNGSVDEAKQETLAAADAAADASDELYQLTQEYIRLSEAVADDISVKEKLITCEDTLIKKLGVEKAEIQELIDKYGSYEDAVKAAAVAKLQDEERDLRSGYHTTAEDLVKKQGEKSIGLATLYGTMAVRVEDDEEAITESAINAINSLISSGKVTSYNANFAEGDFWRGKSLFNILWSGDGVSPDSSEDILAAFEDIKVMLDHVQSTVGDDNPVYDQLLTIYNSAKKDVEAYSNSIAALNSNLAEQYVVTGLIGREMPTTQDDFDAYRQSVIDSAVASGEFVGTQEDIARAIDSILKQNGDFTKFYTISTEGTKGVTVALKTAYEILEEVSDGYDGLASALVDVTADGYLTAEALSTLSKLEKENALAGLQLADILTRDANGYKLAGDALQQYVQALIAQYTITKAFATRQDEDNAIANLQTLQAVLATLAATQEESTDASKARREELEKEQDMYQDQLDKFEELIDLRKDLLQTYKEELDYQKELEKRQRNVTALQTKLSVARLDQSAAGQARVRELEAELNEAQDDLEDFTLEHAIDVLTDQLDSTNAEWKAIIQGKLNEITSLLEALDTTPEVNITTDTSWVQGAISQIEGLLTGPPNKEVVYGSDGTHELYEQWAEDWYAQNPGVYGPPPPMSDGWSLHTSYSTVQEYRNAIQRLTDDMVADNKANGRPETYAVSSQQWQARYRGAMSTSDIVTAKTAYEWLRSYYTSITGKVPNYHTGGLVGDVATLSSSEEFAKLLKGEFVSTPTQMRRFMEDTLPKIANYSATGGSNEFNAPLIEITCESVTTEALPELERIVNKAVKEIKRELDSGMSRTGFKRTPTKRLT